MALFHLISLSVNGSPTTPSRLPRYWSRFVENGIGTCPRWTAHLTHTTAGCTPRRLAIRTITGSSVVTVSSASGPAPGVWGTYGAVADRDDALRPTNPKNSGC